MNSTQEWYDVIHWELYQLLKTYRSRVTLFEAKVASPAIKTTDRTLRALENNRKWVKHYEREIIRHEDEHPQFYNYGFNDPVYVTPKRRIKVMSIARKAKGTKAERLDVAKKVCVDQTNGRPAARDYERIVNNLKLRK